ncbi:MAG: hypothetical protein WHV44_14415 [Anaerolineales bacterium]
MFSRKFLTVLVSLALFVSFIPAGIALAKGRPPTESVNNLSFPVIWSEGVRMSVPGAMLSATLTKPYDVNKDGVITEADMLLCGGVTAYAYAQKTVGNTWQAENANGAGEVVVSEIDWGDSLESVDMKVGRPVRVELTLYKRLDAPMTAYHMVMLANPSSPDEVQGACATTNPGTNDTALTYPSLEATVYSPYAKLVIQKITGTNLTWDGTQWVGDAGAPIKVSFAGELNVGGKVIYGLSTGGWKPTDIGTYRITFYLPKDKNTFFDENTKIRLAAEVTAASEGGEAGGDAVVDPANNLTYIDIRVIGGRK